MPELVPRHDETDLKDWLVPDLGDGAGALMTTRSGGISQGPYASLNLGAHVGDQPESVALNRRILAERIGVAQPCWLTQVHGNRMLRLRASDVNPPVEGDKAPSPQADGVLTTDRGVACTVMVADCLPVLLAAPQGRGVAALHAGWRGLAGAGAMNGQGVVHTGVAALCEAAACEPHELRAWLGPCIGPDAFEVGADVLASFRDVARPGRFVRRVPADRPDGGEPRWLADLPGLARDVLASQGVVLIGGGQWCTVHDPSRFFSFRRDGVCGRMAAAIWLT